MGHSSKRKKESFWQMTVLIVLLLLPVSKAGSAAENEGIQHYKMLSAVEYSGKGQFRNQVETLLTVRKQLLSDNKVQYSLLADDFDIVGGSLSSDQHPSFLSGFSFVVDRQTQNLSGVGEELVFLGTVSNESAKSMAKVTKDNVGKTWKQSLALPSVGNLFASELKFTLTAIELKNKTFGEMIAVRALSEPFVVKVGNGEVNCRINTVYLFDSNIEDVYLSISVFQAETDVNGYRETLRHEVATYKADSGGVPADFSSMGKEFEKFVGKLGLASDGLKIVNSSPLPQWVRVEGVRAAQVANICAATACEGALNPVATVFMPAARMVEFQSSSELLTPNTQLAGAAAGGGGIFQRIVSNWGWNLPTAAVVGGTTVGAVAIGGGFSGGGGSSSRSPSAP